MQEVSWALVWSLVYNSGVKINCSWCYRWEELTGERWRTLGSWWRRCWRCVCRGSLWRRRPWTLSWVRLTDWSRNSSCQQHWVLRSTCELFQDQEIQINSCAAAGRKWSEPFYSEGCNDGYQVFFSILDFFSRCVTTWYCQSKVSVMIQTQAVSESLWVKRAIVELLRAENVTVYFVFVRLNKASTSELYLVLQLYNCIL